MSDTLAPLLIVSASALLILLLTDLSLFSILSVCGVGVDIVDLNRMKQINSLTGYERDILRRVEQGDSR